jgi:hypothetical protein
VALLIPQRVVTDKKPAILPILSACSLFVFKRDAALKRLLALPLAASLHHLDERPEHENPVPSRLRVKGRYTRA